MTTRFKLSLQLGVIIDFAVEGNAKLPIGRLHRLMPGCAQVDDRQPSMPKADTSIVGPVLARIVGAAMRHCVPPGREPASRSNRRFRRNPHYSAHKVSPAFRCRETISSARRCPAKRRCARRRTGRGFRLKGTHGKISVQPRKTANTFRSRAAPGNTGTIPGLHVLSRRIRPSARRSAPVE